jgi:superoxide dismutase, Cu-Zn family
MLQGQTPLRALSAQSVEGRGEIAEVLKDDVGTRRVQLVGGVFAGRHGNYARAVRLRAGNVEWRVADDNNAIGAHGRRQPVSARAVHRHRHQVIAVERVVAERAAAEIPPEVEMTQLHLGRVREIARQQAQQRVRAACERTQQRHDARQDPLARTGMKHFLAKADEVSGAQRRHVCGLDAHPVPDERVDENAAVGPAGHVHARQRGRDTEHVSEGAVHRPLAGAARKDQRAVDVEENEPLDQDNLRQNDEPRLGSGTATELQLMFARPAASARRHDMVHWKGLAIAVAVATAGTTLGARQQAGHQAMHGDMAMMEPLAEATAQIAGSGITGTATLKEYQRADSRVVHIHLSASGLTPGLHGVHLHAIGKCEPAFTAAGGHFDPGPAGNTDPDANHPFHMGDLPNLKVGADGKGELDATTTRVTLTDSPVTLFDADGSAIIIHGNPDQGITGEPKSGVSGGPRVACGVLTLK